MYVGSCDCLCYVFVWDDQGNGVTVRGSFGWLMPGEYVDECGMVVWMSEVWLMFMHG